MPVLDVSFLNPNAKRSGTGAGGYNVLVDQLSILEKNLENDGKLSPGDYDYLIGQAQKLMNSPSLSSDQRSNVAVKIAGYRKNKSTDGLKDTEDISRLNRDVTDSLRQNVTLLANQPNVMLQANADALHAKLSRLADSVNRLDQSGDDPTQHLNEYNNTLSELKDTLTALEDSEKYQAGTGQPGSKFVAYVTTNTKGEISDVQVGRVGKTGYAQTNALYGGMQVYGKVNAKENGKNIFLIGDKRFTAPDNLLPGPDGTFTSSPLIDESIQKGKNYKSVSGTPYVDLDTNNIRAQNTIDAGGWALGEKGTLYQRTPEGQYKKYVNVKPEQYETLGITANNLFKVPRVLEQGILPGVSETIDGAGGLTLPTAPVGQVQYDQPIGPMPAQAGATPRPTPTPTPSPRTSAPTSRAPKDTKGIAGRAYDSAKSFLGGIFG